MNNEYFDSGYKDGVKLACVLYNTSEADSIKSKYFNDTSLEDGLMQFNICKIACSVLDEEDDNCYAKILYNNLMRRIETGEVLSKEASVNLLSPVIESLGSCSFRAEHDLMTKNAFIDEGLSALEALAKSGIALGGVTGASIGAIAWLLNRNANMKDAEIDAKLAQAKHYREIARDIKERLKAKEGDLNAVADKMGEGAYVV